jgi:hypothetical protein
MLRTCLLGLCSLCAWTASLIAAPPAITSLGNVEAVAISWDGDVVVGNRYLDETAGGFRWSRTGGMELLPSPNSDPFVRASSVSGDGLTVIGEVRGAPYRWSTSLGDGFLEIARPSDVSFDGATVVGIYDGILETLTGDELQAYTIPFPGSAASGVELSADGSTVVGGQGLMPIRWTQKRGFDVPGGDVVDLYTYVASDVSTDGKRVLIRSGVRGGSPITYLWDDELGMTTIHSETVVLRAMDDAGELLVGRDGATETAVIWDAENGVRDFKELLSIQYGMEDALEGWRLLQISDVSGDGKSFFGQGTTPTGELTTWVATVPEPSSLAIVAVCMGGLGVYRWKRR